MQNLIKVSVKITCIVAFSLFISGCGREAPKVVNAPKAQNIILFIGDGMGEQHREAARLFAFGQNGLLSMDDMPVRGYSLTKSADHSVTDSAAAATSMATGYKTNNNVVGMDSELNSVPTILEAAKKEGKSAGLITTTQVTHATPASFAAHVSNRDQMNDIAKQMIGEEVDIVLGGGEDEFLPETTAGCYPEPGERTDGQDLIKTAINIGYEYVCENKSFETLEAHTSMKLIGLFADEEMKRPYSPTLAEMTEKAIEILSKNKNGFFLMVEGGQIDWASHSKDIRNTIEDTIGFDRAVAVAKKFADINKQTLVIVTSDHETGGLKVMSTKSYFQGKLETIKRPDGSEFFVSWTEKGHTGAKVPVTAMGPSSELLKGEYENTYIYEVMKRAFGL